MGVRPKGRLSPRGLKCGAPSGCSPVYIVDNYTSVIYLVSAVCLSLWVTFVYRLRMVENESYPQGGVDRKIADYILDLPSSAKVYVLNRLVERLLWRRDVDLDDVIELADEWRRSI